MKNRHITVNIEETLYVATQTVCLKHNMSTSHYLRQLLVRDLIARKLLDPRRFLDDNDEPQL